VLPGSLGGGLAPAAQGVRSVYEHSNTYVANPMRSMAPASFYRDTKSPYFRHTFGAD